MSKLKLFFDPDSIVVIGASRRENSPGYIIFRNLLENRRRGVLRAKVYGVNVKGGEVLGERLFKSILDIPEKIDHAIIAVPAPAVPAVLEECGKKGVSVVTIISGGFSEVGNIELENEVLRIAKHYGIRIIGPNGLGVFDAYTGVDTLFIPEKKIFLGEERVNLGRPKKGHITFLSQSGALGGALLDYLVGEDIGISKFVSWGNKIDVDETDMLPFLLDDETTRVVVIYVEALKKNARKFIELAKRFTLRKPIIALKGGTTEAGARATQGHTASLAGNYRVYFGAFKQAGILIAEDIMDMLDMAKALALQPPAQGNRVGIVTNGGGPGILVADNLEKVGLRVPPLDKKTIDKLKRLVEDKVIPSIATIANPLDLSGTAGDEAYVEATRAFLESDQIDIIIVLLLHHPPTLTDKLPKLMLELLKDHKKPVLIMDIGLGEISVMIRKMFDSAGFPTYTLPRRVASGAKALFEYGEWLKKQKVTV